MTVKIYTWKSGQTNILCDNCADHMIVTLINRVIENNPDLTPDEYQNLDSMKELDFMDTNAVECKFKCQPINKDTITGLPVCLSDLYIS